MLPLSQRVAFLLFAVLCLVLGARGFFRLFLRVRRGRPDPEARWNGMPGRLWYALRTTLTQQRVFRKRPLLSVFHAFIFYAFVLYLVVNLLDAIDGFYPLPSHLPSALATIYAALTDLFSVLALLGVVAFVLRRFALPARRDFRFNPHTLLAPAVRAGYMQRDSLVVAAFIIFHISSRVIGNAAHLALTGPQRAQPFSSSLAPAFAGPHAMAWRIFGYWGALGSVLLFLVYFPYSKHVHILVAPLKYLVRRDQGSGTLPPVTLDLEGAEPQIGAARLADLSWPRLLDAYACIQCNRCQDVCPATQTGKALSPSALEINKRMALNDLTRNVSAFSLTRRAPFEAGTSAGPALMEAVLPPEAVWACTTCGACMQVCPTQDEQMLDIIDMRRDAVLLQGDFPPQLQSAFRGMERNSNPWAMARDKRMEWAAGLEVPTIDDVPNPEVLYWVGCAASYDPAAQKTARATVQLLREAKVSFAVLGKRECCTGDSARRAGNELLYQQMATTAISTLQEVQPRTVLASCPHCVNTIATEYPQLGGNFRVQHHTEFLAALVQDGRLAPVASDTRVTFHDPCYLGRHRGTYKPPRALLNILSNDVVELPRNRENAFCCGAGGAQFWKEEEPGTERISGNRMREVQQTLGSAEGDKVLAVGCPFCKSMLQSTPAENGSDAIVIKDVAELLWEGVQRAQPPSQAIQADAALPSGNTRPEGVELASAALLPPAAPEPLAAQFPHKVVTPPEAEPTTAPVNATGPASVVRKKWAPKGAAPIPAPSAPAPELHSAPAPEPPSAPAAASIPIPSEAPTTKAPSERKKWAPKNTAATSPTPTPSPGEQAAPPTATPEQAPAALDTSTSTSEPAPASGRRKWQPKGPR